MTCGIRDFGVFYQTDNQFNYTLQHGMIQSAPEEALELT